MSEQTALLEEAKQPEEPTQVAQAKLTSERAALEKDRAKITKLALLLGQEKAQFAKDKDALEQERKQFESMKALAAHDTPHWLMDMDISKLSLEDLSDDDGNDTLAQLLREGENMASPTSLTPPVSGKKTRSRYDPDLPSPRSPQSAKVKPPTSKPSVPKQASRSNSISTLARPTAAAMLKAQATQARLIQRRDSKQKQSSSQLPPTPRSSATAKPSSSSLRTKSKSLSSTNLNSL